MTRRKNNKKKGIHPGIAVLLLLGSVAFVTPKLMGSLSDNAASGIASLIGLDEEDDPELDELSEAEEVAWVDLIAMFGSVDRQPTVRMAFAAAPDINLTPSAPGGEMAPDGERWIGDDPPLMRLGVIMVSEKSRRAVLGGSVVGVGDAINGGEVVAIDPGELRMRWQQRVLTYDLDSEVPREFRAESARRRLAAGRAVEAEGDAGQIEQGTEEK